MTQAADIRIDPTLVRAVRTLAKNPALAELQLRRILKAHPNELNAAIYLARALRAQGKSDEAVAVLEAVGDAHPTFGPAHYELALAYSDLNRPPDAIAGLRRTLEIDPNFAFARLVLADTLFDAGDKAGADETYMAHVDFSAGAAVITEAMTALHNDEFDLAEATLRAHLARLPTDVAALAVLGETKGRQYEYEEAAAILERCLARAPSFDIARLNYATILCRLQRADDALPETQKLLDRAPKDPRYRALHATTLNQLGESKSALACFESLLDDFPGDSKSWTGYGHALRGEGQSERAVAAYRKGIEINARDGSAYWGIANLKTTSFSAEEIRGIEAALASDGLPEDDRLHFHFALGKALEDERDYEGSFTHYQKGNAIRFAQLRYDPDHMTNRVREMKRVLMQPLFEQGNGGAQNPDPIFIVGLPRSGSTLIEQILASHSAVEGTAELLDLRVIAGELGKDGVRYPECLARLPAPELRALGERYISVTRRHRRTSRPFFTDKMPANFEHTGLIHLILPNAKIIDARRHPMACCFSNYKQLFAQGQNFTYDLVTLGRWYGDYVELMAHVDRVLPGRVHRVFHEDIVANPEREIGRLLEHCGLPFEDACLKFYNTDRLVRTVSSEQVRRPIFASGIDHWRNYERWLELLKVALGSALETYPDVLEFE